jgi:hypothetical protein
MGSRGAFDMSIYYKGHIFAFSQERKKGLGTWSPTGNVLENSNQFLGEGKKTRRQSFLIVSHSDQKNLTGAVWICVLYSVTNIYHWLPGPRHWAGQEEYYGDQDRQELSML